MSNLKKRTILITLCALASVLVFVQSAYASTTVWLSSDQHSAYSSPVYFSEGDTIQFYGSSSITSDHNVILGLFDSSNNLVDSVLIPPNTSDVGDTYTVTESGYFIIGLGLVWDAGAQDKMVVVPMELWSYFDVE